MKRHKSHQENVDLMCLMYDLVKARELSALVNIGEQEDVARRACEQQSIFWRVRERERSSWQTCAGSIAPFRIISSQLPQRNGNPVAHTNTLREGKSQVLTAQTPDLAGRALLP